jgi:hypothetical protein
MNGEPDALNAMRSALALHHKDLLRQKENIMKTDCDKLGRLNALVTEGEVEHFDVFKKDFCLTDIVMDLWTFPEGLNSKASCSVWLVTPSASTSEILFKFFIDKHGHQVHLNSGVFCPEGSYLTANSGIFAEGATASLRVLLTGYYC